MKQNSGLWKQIEKLLFYQNMIHLKFRFKKKLEP